MLVAVNGSVFTCTRVHTSMWHISFFSEIGEQIESSARSSQTFPLSVVVFGVTLATCTLLFRLLLYSQYYEFSVLKFFCNFVAF